MDLWTSVKCNFFVNLIPGHLIGCPEITLPDYETTPS